MSYVAYHDDKVVVVDRQIVNSEITEQFMIEWAGTDKWEKFLTQSQVVEQLARRGHYEGALSMLKYGADGKIDTYEGKVGYA